MKTVIKTIGIGDFMKLWDNAFARRYSDIISNVELIIMKEWKEEIAKRFKELKKKGSYGPLTNFEALMTNMVNPGSLGRVPYNPDYAAANPRVGLKTGELEGAMGDKSLYDIDYSQGVAMKVNIPLKKDNLPEQYNAPFDPDKIYRNLEEQRSFVRSSLLMVWPKILQDIMDNIG